MCVNVCSADESIELVCSCDSLINWLMEPNYKSLNRLASDIKYRTPKKASTPNLVKFFFLFDYSSAKIEHLLLFACLIRSVVPMPAVQSKPHRQYGYERQRALNTMKLLNKRFFLLLKIDNIKMRWIEIAKAKKKSSNESVCIKRYNRMKCYVYI